MRKMLLGIFLIMAILTISMPHALAPLEIMPRCSAAGFNAPLEFLTGFASEPPPSIQFETMEYDFGKVLEGKALSYTFHFTNRGEGILEIKGIKPG